MNSPTTTPLLLDTTVFSFLLKQTDTRLALYLPDIQGQLLALSFITIGETYRWAFQNHWGARRIQDFEEKLRSFVILDSHNEISRQWARIMSNHGQPVSSNDAWIAACALVYGCILVTHDRDFSYIPGLHIISHI